MSDMLLGKRIVECNPQLMTKVQKINMLLYDAIVYSLCILITCKCMHTPSLSCKASQHCSKEKGDTCNMLGYPSTKVIVDHIINIELDVIRFVRLPVHPSAPRALVMYNE